jgi:hypothetical protein
MSIQQIAILYGDARNGRSCETCNYFYSTITVGMCGMHELPTRLSKVCGQWCCDKVKKEPETQKELF